MTAPELDLLSAFHEVFGTPTYRLPCDPAADYDEDSLRRSFGGLSRAARREQRRPLSLRPVEPWRDEVAAAESGSDWWEAS